MSTIKTWEERCTISTTARGERALMQAEITELRKALKVSQKENARLTECVRSARIDEAHCWGSRVDALQAKLSAIEAQEPVAWMEWDLELGEGDPDSITAGKEKPDLCADGWDWAALYLTTHVAPAQPVNELVEALGGAIMYINSYAFANWQPVVMALHKALAKAAPLVVNSERTKPVVSQNPTETVDKAAQPLDHLQDLSAFIGVGGYNGATTEQLVERIKAEFQRVTAQPLTKEQVEKVQKALALYRLPVSQIDVSVLDEAIEIMKGVM